MATEDQQQSDAQQGSGIIGTCKVTLSRVESGSLSIGLEASANLNPLLIAFALSRLTAQLMSQALGLQESAEDVAEEKGRVLRPSPDLQVPSLIKV